MNERNQQRYEETQARILEQLFQELGVQNRQFAELGFNTDGQCEGSGSNTCSLWRDQGWRDLMINFYLKSDKNRHVSPLLHALFSALCSGCPTHP